MRVSGDELEDLIRRVAEKMVEASGGILMPGEAESFIRMRLAQWLDHEGPPPSKGEQYADIYEEQTV
jgi:hypothetical protein